MKTPRAFALVLAVFTLGVSVPGVGEALGKIHGVVANSCQPDATGTLVFIPGRSFVAITGSSGEFQLDAVPAGTYTIRIESPGQGPTLDVPNVVVKGVRTTDLHTITLSGDLQTDIMNCGACGVVCSSAHGTPACVAGQCQITCNAGFANCDADPANGCEVNVQTSVANCGGCGVACSGNNGTPVCTAGVCQISCDAGFANCDGSPTNGCETNIQTSVANCGGCGIACSSSHGTPTCSGGVCQISCNAGFANCDADASNGCETNIQTSFGNCGACGFSCSPGQVCAFGVCQ